MGSAAACLRARLRQILQRVRQPRPAGVAPPVRRAIERLDRRLPTRRDAGLGDEDHRTLHLLRRIGVDRQGGPELDRARAQLPGQLAERQDGEHRVFARRCRCAGAARVREIVGNEKAHDHVVVVHVRSGLGRAPKRERDTAIGAIARPREHRLAHPCLERGVGDGSWVPDFREGRRPAGARALVHEHRAHDVPAQAHRRTRAAPVLDPNVRGERGRGVATGDDHGARLVLADREGLRDLGLALGALDQPAIGEHREVVGREGQQIVAWHDQRTFPATHPPARRASSRRHARRAGDAAGERAVVAGSARSSSAARPSTVMPLLDSASTCRATSAPLRRSR